MSLWQKWSPACSDELISELQTWTWRRCNCQRAWLTTRSIIHCIYNYFWQLRVPIIIKNLSRKEITIIFSKKNPIELIISAQIACNIRSLSSSLWAEQKGNSTKRIPWHWILAQRFQNSSLACKERQAQNPRYGYCTHLHRNMFCKNCNTSSWKEMKHIQLSEEKFLAIENNLLLTHSQQDTRKSLPHFPAMFYVIFYRLIQTISPESN